MTEPKLPDTPPAAVRMLVFLLTKPPGGATIARVAPPSVTLPVTLANDPQ